jgi:hypothetical protein
MFINSLALVLFLLMMLVTLPNARVRFGVLTVMHRLLHLGVMAVIALCGTFFFWPDLVPGPVADIAELMAVTLADFVPSVRDQHEGFVWLVLAAMVLAVSLPVLVHVDYSRRLTGHSALISRFRRELLASARSLERRLTQPSDGAINVKPPAGEVTAAVEALRSLADSPEPTRPRLVKDYLS